MKNRDGYIVEIAPITEVDFYDDGGCAITRGEPGWGTFGLSAEELNGFKPQVGDVVVVYTQNLSMIRGVVIDGRVLRYHTPAQAKAEAEQRQKDWRLEKLERYIKEGDALKERVKKLHPVLQARIARFEAEKGVEFWIEDAGYEMYALEGAQALLNKVAEVFEDEHIDNWTDEARDAAVEWINDWWDKDYSEQMELVPDFGDGHSGWTASAAKGMAVMILSGRGSEL